MIQWYFDGASTKIFTIIPIYFRQRFPSKYSHQIFPSHIPTLKDDLSQGECITSQDSTSWSARLGRERVHLHDRHRGLVRGLHGRKARKGPGLGQWRWAERRGSPWTFLGKILQSSYLGGETSWWFQHVSNMFQFFSRRNGTHPPAKKHGSRKHQDLWEKQTS